MSFVRVGAIGLVFWLAVYSAYLFGIHIGEKRPRPPIQFDCREFSLELNGVDVFERIPANMIVLVCPRSDFEKVMERTKSI